MVGGGWVGCVLCVSGFEFRDVVDVCGCTVSMLRFWLGFGLRVLGGVFGCGVCVGLFTFSQQHDWVLGSATLWTA